jgi:hypothetical protein
MSKMYRVIASCLFVLAACKGKGKESNDETTAAAVTESAAPAAKKAGCSFLSEAKVKEITGVAVTAHEHGNPQSCALFKTADDKDFLLVSTDSASSYNIFLESNPPKMYPLRTPLTGVGTEAILLRWSENPGSSRALFAHNDERTVVLTPMPLVDVPPITDAQLTEIARASMAK